MNRLELENRLVDFAVSLIELCKHFDNDFAGDYLSKQLLRSGSAPALNYGEAQGAESKKDFIHKSSIVLKELRETNVNLKIVSGASICKEKDLLEKTLDESNQLVAMFYKSVETAKKNLYN